MVNIWMNELMGEYMVDDGGWILSGFMVKFMKD